MLPVGSFNQRSMLFSSPLNILRSVTSRKHCVRLRNEHHKHVDDSRKETHEQAVVNECLNDAKTNWETLKQDLLKSAKDLNSAFMHKVRDSQRSRIGKCRHIEAVINEETDEDIVCSNFDIEQSKGGNGKYSYHLFTYFE